MSLHIIIDGYNLIRQSDRLSALDRQDMQRGRETLVDWLIAYRRIRHHRISVVFDGGNAPFFSQHRDRLKGIEIRFSRPGETADSVIKRMASREREKALVVSSDREVVDFAESRGAATISSCGFEEKIGLAAQMDETAADAAEDSGWNPTTRKKGPRKRLSRKKRRNRIKTQKL